MCFQFSNNSTLPVLLLRGGKLNIPKKRNKREGRIFPFSFIFITQQEHHLREKACTTGPGKIYNRSWIHPKEQNSYHRDQKPRKDIRG